MFSAGAAPGRVILFEDFESFTNTKAMRAVWTSGPAQLVTGAPGGGNSAAHDGSGMNRRGGFFVFSDDSHNIVLSADFYDFATNTDQNVTISLNGDDGHQNVAMGLKGPHCYVVRVGGFGTQTNWVPFKRGQVPVEGWHRFKVVLSTTNVQATLDLHANGSVEHTINIPTTSFPPTFTQIRFGGYASKLAGSGPVLIDNIKLEVVSLPPAVIAAVSTPPLSKTDELHLSPSPPVAVAAETSTKPSASPGSPKTLSGPQAWEQTSSVIPPATTGSSHEVVTASQIPHSEQTLSAAGYWIGAALAVIILLLLSLMFTLKRHAALLPRALLTEGRNQSPASAAIMIAPSEDEAWRQRALQAEALAAKQAQVLGEKVGPELVEFAKQTLVQGLYSQRNALMETQLKAKQTLVELEARLSELHLPAQERIRAYERRIAEMEKDLASRSDEMRQLTQATLLLVRQKLEQEREEQTPRFN